MKKEIKYKRLLLLMDSNSCKSADVRDWLMSKGFVAWRASDFSHAIEELSDFTVKKRPDVVMLEVSPVCECLRSLRSTLCVNGLNDVSVVAVSDKSGPGRSGRFYAKNLDQLETIVYREAGPMPC